MTLATAVPTTSPTRELGIEALRARLTGTLITPESDNYDDVRKVQDVTVDRHPSIIVQAATAGDVAEAVRYARRAGLPIAVRSGGHSVAGHGMADGALVVDFSNMRGISIDPAARTARVQAGVRSGDLAAPAHAYGLALSTGDTSTVAMGGLTTGAGIGFMARTHGLAIDNLLSAQVVTADGAIVKASESENPDLFWGIRGGGGNFGVITEFEFRLAPVGQVIGGALLLPATREVIRGYLDYTVDAPDGLTTLATLMHAPPAPFVPEERVGEMVFNVLITWDGDAAEGERVIAPLRALGTPVADAVGPMPYPVMYNFTAHQAEPHAWALRSMFADEISDAQIDAALDAVRNATSPFSGVHFRGLGGAMSRVANDATAFAHRDRKYLVLLLGLWMDPEDDGASHQAWTEALWEEMRPAARGVYVNFLGGDGAERISEAYPPRTFARLRELKRRYDPTNLFRFNQNILPD
jgi:FAD/FMN-containing dehydrogenase